MQPSPSVLESIRQSLLSHLTLVLGNDELAAQCLLLHLLSRVCCYKSDDLSTEKIFGLEHSNN
jgi:hypothetical protein